MTTTAETVACCAPLAAPTLTDVEADATANLFKALADPARVRIVNRIATSADPVCACELNGPLGLAQPTVGTISRSSRTPACSTASNAASGPTSR